MSMYRGRRTSAGWLTPADGGSRPGWRAPGMGCPGCLAVRRLADRCAVVGGLVLGTAFGAWADALPVPNGSFETPPTLFVDTNLEAWERTERPADYDESGGFLWSQLTGVFRNTPSTSADHITNCDGNQALWVFAVPGVGFFQDYESRDWNDGGPGHAFDVRFEEGRSYTLTVGVIGGGGGMAAGASLDLSLYYRGEGTNRVAVATTRVVNDPGAPRSAFTDYRVRVPVVRAEDPWAGRHLGIQVLSTVAAAGAGGYWDLDHVRLEAAGAPRLTDPRVSGDTLTFTVQGETGAVFDVLAAGGPGEALARWEAVGTVTNHGVGAVFVTGTTNAPQRYYRAVQRP